MKYARRALLALVAVALMLSVAVWYWGPRTYASTGIVQIDARTLTPEFFSRHPSFQEMYVAQAIQNLQSDSVAHEAMKSPEWKAHRKAPPETYLKRWKKNLTAKAIPDSFDVAVTYTDDSPDAGDVAPIAVKSAIEAYIRLYADEGKGELLEKKNRQQRKLLILDQKIADSETQIAGLIRTDGEELQKVFDSKFVVHVEFETELHRLRAKDASAEKSEIERAQKLYDNQKAELDDLSGRTHRVNIIRAEEIRLEEDRRKVRNKIDELDQEIAVFHHMKVIDPGTPAHVVSWHRRIGAN